MRIIAGEWRGRPITAPAGPVTRPTADRVREAMFSMLTSRLGSFEGLAVADLFAGSGAFGLEALSRGAAHALFVDHDAAAVAAIRANAARLGLAADRFEVRQQAAERVVSATPLDLVLLDPPYGSGLGARALGHLLHRGGIAAGGWVAIETGRAEEPLPAGFTAVAERVFGKAKLTLAQPG